MLYSLAFRFPQGMEWLIILVVALLVFGKRLPELGRSLGRGLVEFKKGLKGMEEEIKSANKDVDDAVNKSDTAPPKPAQPARLETDSTSTISEKATQAVSERT